jgi:hypothetical protein
VNLAKLLRQLAEKVMGQPGASYQLTTADGKTTVRFDIAEKVTAEQALDIMIDAGVELGTIESVHAPEPKGRRAFVGRVAAAPAITVALTFTEA